MKPVIFIKEGWSRQQFFNNCRSRMIRAENYTWQTIALIEYAKFLHKKLYVHN